MKPFAFCIVLSLMLSCVASAAVRYEVIGLGQGPGMARAVNNKGQVVGNIGGHAFLWENGQMQYLGEGDAYSINNLGQVVGWESNDSACLWQNGIRIDLPYLGYSNIAYDINDSGQIVGRTVYPDTGDRGVLYQNGALEIDSTPHCDYNAINNEGVVVGDQAILDGSNRNQAFVIGKDGVRNNLTTSWDALRTSPRSINDLGQIAGWIYTQEGHSRACMWQADGSYIDLWNLGDNCWANSINSAGQIVGTDGSWKALMWENSKIYDLNTLISGDSGWVLHEAWGINDLGWIVGMGEGPDNNTAFLLKPVPEPATILLVSIGAFLARPRKTSIKGISKQIG